MANFEARSIFIRIGMKLYRCCSSLLAFNTTGSKISSWWLFLCVVYISCFVVGVIFTVAGYSSKSFDMTAVGVILVIAGACLAIFCAVLRRFGCGWTKIVDSGLTDLENSDVFAAMPFLPSYPGICISSTTSDSPPRYEITLDQEETIQLPTRNCSVPTTMDSTSPSSENESGATGISSTLENLSCELYKASGVPNCKSRNSENHSCFPAPPPYRSGVLCSPSMLSLSNDSPPPYAEFV